MKLATLGTTKISILVLALITGVIHLTLGGPLFILNGLGYLALTAAYILKPGFLKPVQAYLGWIFLGFAAVTVVMYFIMADPIVSGLGLFTKAVEVVLIVQLLRDR